MVVGSTTRGLSQTEWGELLTQLRFFEGLSLEPYRDTNGHWTVGYGHNLETSPITKDTADLILVHDAQKAILEAREVYPDLDSLSPARRVVLVNMCFNLGRRGLSKFVRTLRAIKEGDYLAAKKGMLASKWASQVGERRSKPLAHMMETGEFEKVGD